MSFQNKNLSVIAYANGFTLWHYAAMESLDEIGAAGYFDPVRALMNAGDILIVNASDDTAIRKVSATAINVTTAKLS
jgi:hypothetical protein